MYICLNFDWCFSFLTFAVYGSFSIAEVYSDKLLSWYSSWIFCIASKYSVLHFIHALYIKPRFQTLLVTSLPLSLCSYFDLFSLRFFILFSQFSLCKTLGTVVLGPNILPSFTCNELDATYCFWSNFPFQFQKSGSFRRTIVMIINNIFE